MKWLKSLTLPTIMLINLILAALFLQMTFKTNYMKNKKSPFECGFESMTNKKCAFSTNFLMISMMFLVFDVEMSFLIPMVTMSKNIVNSVLLMSLTFILLLACLMVKEWKQGSLEWNK